MVNTRAPMWKAQEPTENRLVARTVRSASDVRYNEATKPFYHILRATLPSRLQSRFPYEMDQPDLFVKYVDQQRRSENLAKHRKRQASAAPVTFKKLLGNEMPGKVEASLQNLKIQEHLARYSDFYKPRLQQVNLACLQKYWFGKLKKPCSTDRVLEVAEAALLLRQQEVSFLSPLWLGNFQTILTGFSASWL